MANKLRHHALPSSDRRSVPTADFDYLLPRELIAQLPAPRRDSSRLLLLHRATKIVEHHLFSTLPHLLRPGDLLVLNNSRVLRARLRGRKHPTGAAFEFLLLKEISLNHWSCLLRPAKRAPLGSSIAILDPHGGPTGIGARILDKHEDGSRRIQFEGTPDIRLALDRLGEIPLPPYIERPTGTAGLPAGAGSEAFSTEDSERYQTVYARHPGSVAAPTAGLHFTPELLQELTSRGIETAEVTLHVGLGTFAPVKEPDPALHPMHEERFVVPPAAARAVTRAKAEGRRVVAVGTTSLRVLESAADPSAIGTAAIPAGVPSLTTGEGRTRIFIYPPRRFRIVDALITNFHLPRTTLLMLVSAFADPGGTGGLDLILKTYAEAIRERYRFYSYGDAMLIQ